jgi:hypothetical protein
MEAEMVTLPGDPFSQQIIVQVRVLQLAVGNFSRFRR